VTAVDGLPAVTTRDLTKAYGPVVALDGLDLDVPAGSAVGLLGPSGAGKTTAIRLMAGLAGPTRGTVAIAGLPMELGDGYEARRRTGMLEQDPRFYGWMTGRELLAFVADLAGVPRPEVEGRIEELVDGVGLAAGDARRISQLNIGERRRLGLAQALIGRPEVVLLDDPVGGLDPATASELLAWIAGLRASTTVVMSSAHPAHVERVCDRVAVLEHGQLVVDARVDALIGGVSQTVYVIEVDPGPGVALAGLVTRLRRERWVREASVDRHVLRVAVADEGRAAHELLPAVVSTGVSVATFQRERPTLTAAVGELLDRASRNGSEP
jgi:ABC-2 type transport system ATP-binding protein